jgi:hypothetical protein
MLPPSSGSNGKPSEQSIITLLDCLAYFLTVTVVRTSGLKITASINAMIARRLKRGVKSSSKYVEYIKYDDVKHGYGVTSTILSIEIFL